MSKYFILIFLFLSFNLSAEIVKKIDVQGNERISKETIKVYGNITLNNNYSTENISKNIAKVENEQNQYLRVPTLQLVKCGRNLPIWGRERSLAKLSWTSQNPWNEF